MTCTCPHLKHQQCGRDRRRTEIEPSPKLTRDQLLLLYTMTGSNEDRHGFLARIRSGEGVVQREFGGQEYETKFAMERAHNDETIEYLRDIEKCFHDDDRYLLDTVHDESRYTSHFFESPEGEYSVFEYGGSPMLKIKGHQIDAGDTLPVFLNTERFITDKPWIRRII